MGTLFMLGLAFIGVIIVFSFLVATAYNYAAKFHRKKRSTLLPRRPKQAVFITLKIPPPPAAKRCRNAPYLQ